MSDKRNKIAELETLLFQYGDPISLKKISNVLNIGKDKAEDLINQYQHILDNDEKRGLILLRNDGSSYQLVTKPSLSHITQQLAEDEFSEELTPAVLEVLTIVAYLGPVGRADIDFIRGVNSGYTLRRLLMRGLIEREKDGRSYEYKVTFDFLKHLGLNRVEDLPEYDEYKDLLEEYEVAIDDQEDN